MTASWFSAITCPRFGFDVLSMGPRSGVRSREGPASEAYPRKLTADGWRRGSESLSPTVT